MRSRYFLGVDQSRKRRLNFAHRPLPLQQDQGGQERMRPQRFVQRLDQPAGQRLSQYVGGRRGPADYVLVDQRIRFSVPQAMYELRFQWPDLRLPPAQFSHLQLDRPVLAQ